MSLGGRCGEGLLGDGWSGDRALLRTAGLDPWWRGSLLVSLAAIPWQARVAQTAEQRTRNA